MARIGDSARRRFLHHWHSQ